MPLEARDIENAYRLATQGHDEPNCIYMSFEGLLWHAYQRQCINDELIAAYGYLPFTVMPKSLIHPVFRH